MDVKQNAFLNNDTQGLLTSVLIHGILLAFMWFYSVNSSLVENPPIEEGMAIALGFEEESSIGDQIKGEQTEELTPPDTKPSPPTPPAPQPKTEIITTKESPVTVKATPPKSDAKPAPKTPPPTTVNTNNTKPSNNSSQETAKNNDAEVSEKKKKFGSLFGGGGQGNKDGDGPQGDPNGNPDSKVLDGISKGRGTIGGGLAGRKVVNAPTLSESSQKQGRVVIKVCVDKTGQVISAKFTQGGSTTSDAQLVSLAEKGAMKYKFASGELDSQCGTISFEFKVS
jgi:outer membrane biosynthesis protein TonB